MHESGLKWKRAVKLMCTYCVRRDTPECPVNKETCNIIVAWREFAGAHYNFAVFNFLEENGERYGFKVIDTNAANNGEDS